MPAVRRNLWQELRPILREMGFQIRERLSQNRIDVSLGRRRNTFYLFGGLDERSAALVQGITLAWSRGSPWRGPCWTRRR